MTMLGWDSREIHTRLLSENLKGRGHLQDLGLDGKMCTGFMELRTGTSGGAF
jgi:hypothetical protein